MMRKHQEMMSQQEEHMKYYAKHTGPSDHKTDVKQEFRKELGPGPYDGHVKREPGLSSGGIKQEGQANFSLYGYKPDKFSFITTDQLHSYELEKIKGEKSAMDIKVSRAQSPRKKDLSVPPPLIKDSKPYSSVIVENKTKDMNIHKTSSPQYASRMSPHHHPKPAHTPERPHSSHSSPGAQGMNPIAAHSQHVANLRADAARQTSRSQSPLRIASPQQLSAAVMEPMDYRCNPNVNKTRGSPGSNSSSHPSSVNSSSFSPAIAQAPVSLPHTSVPFTYSLIQQGLVPNPIYSNNSNVKTTESQRTVSVTGTAQVPRAAQSPQSGNREQLSHQQQQQNTMGSKRKGQKEGTNRKRQKFQEGQPQNPTVSNANPLNLSIPCTTPQIVSNQSPYTTGSASVSSIAVTTAQSGVSTTTSSQAVVNNRLHGLTGFMDSFKSFVENTVQNAFMSDPDLTKTKDSAMKKPHSASDLRELQAQQQMLQQQQQQQPQQQQQQKTQPYKPKSSLERSCTPVISSQQSSQNDEASNLSNSGNSSNPAMSYVDSINRVANGQIDTDSDTLSAPSPPPHLKQDNTPSPHKSAKHPNLKKAWLQRHSDEDKQEAKPPVPVPAPGPVVVADNVNSNTNSSTNPTNDLEKDKEKEVKNCYVKISNISPTKENGNKSPISNVSSAPLPNGSIEKLENIDESTTSASETETMVSTYLYI